MRARAIPLLLALALPAGAPADSVPASGPSRLDAACAHVKTAVAAHDGLAETGPAGMGWFCDFAQTGSELDDHWYLIALRSNRTCEGDCSNLMGWYAVHRENGEVREFDIGEFAIGPGVAAPDGVVR
jgi:hypothetical protein